jgi:pilus assembly protein CpaC
MAFTLPVGDLQLSILLEALETKGMARTLAEPNLTALSGQQARSLPVANIRSR